MMDISKWSKAAVDNLVLVLLATTGVLFVTLLLGGNALLQVNRNIVIVMIAVGVAVILGIVYIGLVRSGESSIQALKKTIAVGIFFGGLGVLLSMFANIKK